MITTFDELSSHLHTTFSALSTALARNQNHAGTHTAYLALVIGPSIGVPKARVILALEGLEVKIWGEREKDDGTDDCSSDDGSQTSGDSLVEEAEEDPSSDVTDTEESPISPPASEPPSSRSPSPSSSEVPSLQSSSAPAVSNSRAGRSLRPSLSPKSSSSGSTQPHLVPHPTRTYAEEQQTLRAAERLLARTLVNAYAEGGGIAAELGAYSLSSLYNL